MFSYILFDLDGTISDPKEGITKSVQYALSSFGIEEPDLDKLEPFIGPPLRDSFMEFYGFTAGQAEEAVAKYRERFSVTGKYENELYPGMKELLRDLQAAGVHLAIASSKPTVFVEDILKYFQIRQYFEIVVGSELDGTRDRKEEVVAEVLAQFAREGAADPSCVVMIGDRRFDIEGAIAAGTHHIGVNYGYAAVGELEEAGAEIVVRDVEGLRRVLLGVQGVRTGAAGAEPEEDRRRETSRLQPPPYVGGGMRHPVKEGTWDQRGSMPGEYGRYRPERKETKGKRIAKAIGISLLAMLTYYVVNVMAASFVMLASMLVPFLNADFSFNFFLNLGSAVGTLAGFAACFAIWHKGIRLRPCRPMSGISFVPMLILAASAAMGMNGLLSLIELYKYSPAFQEISEIQFDIPVWLGILTYGILAPLGEETVFRGVVYGQLKKVSNVPVAIAVSGLVFGLFHGNLVQAVYATVIGVLLALVYEIYDSILAAMVFHSVANLFVYVLGDLTGFGGAFMAPIPCAFFLFLSVLSLILMVRWQKSA